MKWNSRKNNIIMKVGILEEIVNRNIFCKGE